MTPDQHDKLENEKNLTTHFCLEDGERGHEPRNEGSLEKLEKARKQILP